MPSARTIALLVGWFAGAVYLASMALPPFQADRVTRGVAAVWLAGIGVAFLFQGDETRLGLCCLLGSLANLGFIVGWLMFALRATTPLRRPRLGTLAVLTIAAVTCGIGSAAALEARSDVFVLGVGCFVWITGQALLAAGATMLACLDIRRRTARGGCPIVLRAEASAG
jgi:hypothetical protein